MSILTEPDKVLVLAKKQADKQGVEFADCSRELVALHEQSH